MTNKRRIELILQTVSAIKKIEVCNDAVMYVQLTACLNHLVVPFIAEENKRNANRPKVGAVVAQNH